MKNGTMRALSLLLAMVLCLGTLSGVTFTAEAATVEYVKVGDYVKNWGKREETATFLSPMAEAFYADNNTSYAKLSQYTGATGTASSVANSALYDVLQELMASNHSTITSYNETKNLYQYTDCQASGNKISAFYSGTSVGPSWDGSFNREHTWPNSKGLNGSDENDLMMLRPTTTNENSGRGNKAYGESSGLYDPNEYAGYNLHGDVARIMLYVYVRWGNTDLFVSEVGADNAVLESKALMLRWMEEDPVDTWELGRNDACESILGTRNVFVDYPELAFVLFGEEVPADMTTPSGEAKSFSQYTITATSSNDSWGTVTQNGRTLTAVPKTGYQVVGYTVVSGTASVAQKGNEFVVSATSDCTVRINFAERTPASVAYSENGGPRTIKSMYVDDVFVLPAATATIPEHYTFLGWVTGNVEETATKPATIYPVGTSYPVTGSVDFYALYARVDATASPDAGLYELYNGTLLEGDYLIVYDGGAMQAVDADLNERPDGVDVTASNGIIATNDETLVWHIAPTADGYYTIYNAENGVYAGGNGVNNKAALLSEVTDYAKWTVTGAGDYTMNNLGNANAGKNATLKKNGDIGFGCYMEALKELPLNLYRAVNGTIYYSTTTVTCEHANTKQMEAVDATCTEAGHTAGVYCLDCGIYISGHELIEALNHSYNAVVTPPTATEGGYTTYTCTRCSHSYVDDRTDALGETYTVSFAVPSGVTAIGDQDCNKTGITLPSAGVPTGDYTYTFAGWAAQSVETTQTAPTLYAEGESFVADADTTLYAVYTYSTGGGADSGYIKVTEAPSDWSGEYVIVYEEGSLIMDGSLSKLDAAGNTQSVTITNGKISAEEGDDYRFIIAAVDGGYSVQSIGGIYIGKTSNSSNGMNENTGIVYSNTISMNDDGTVNIIGNGGPYLRYNDNDGQLRFRYYKSSTYTLQQPIHLYKLSGSAGATYYTSVGAKVEPKPELVKFTNVSMNLGNSLTMYFKVNAADITGTGNKAVITKNYADGREPVVTEIAQKDWLTEGELYSIPVENIAAKEMSDIVSVVIQDGSGNAISEVKNSSVRAYAMMTLNTSSDAKLLTLMAELLNYGAAAQTQFGYGTSDLANAKMNATHQSYATADTSILAPKANRGDAIKVQSFNMTLESNLLLNLKYYPADVTENMTAKVSYTTHAGTVTSYEIPGSAFEMGTDGYLWVSLSSLAAADINTVATVEIISNGAVISTTQINMAVAVAIDGGATPAMTAMSRYCVAAYNFFH